MTERLKVAVLKTVVRLREPWVRIPPSPLDFLYLCDTVNADIQNIKIHTIRQKGGDYGGDLSI